MKTIITLVFCFLTVSLTVEAQQTVTGRITDRSDGTPIPGASVFIAHTTIGTHTDREGNFFITVPIQGSFQVAVSHLGFQSASRTIDSPETSHIVNFALEEQVTMLPEVVVTPCLPHRRRDENIFWENLLGERPSNRGMQVLNPEVIHFCLLPMGVLRVFADEPIEIVNHTMGYRISYVLHRFEHDFDTERTRMYGVPFFTELTPQNERQRNDWERRRRMAYSVSITHFIRALYREQLYESGFLVAQVDGLTPLLPTEADAHRMGLSFSPAERAVATFSYGNLLQREEDGVQVHIRQPIFVGFISRPVTRAMFNDPLETFFLRSATFPLIRILPTSNITIYSDGSYSGLLHIVEYRNTVVGLRTRVPLEFGMNEENVVQVINSSLRRGR